VRVMYRSDSRNIPYRDSVPKLRPIFCLGVSLSEPRFINPQGSCFLCGWFLHRKVSRNKVGRFVSKSVLRRTNTTGRAVSGSRRCNVPRAAVQHTSICLQSRGRFRHGKVAVLICLGGFRRKTETCDLSGPQVNSCDAVESNNKPFCCH
jgi:hypothetical protein